MPLQSIARISVCQAEGNVFAFEPSGLVCDYRATDALLIIPKRLDLHASRIRFGPLRYLTRKWLRLIGHRCGTKMLMHDLGLNGDARMTLNATISLRRKQNNC